VGHWNASGETGEGRSKRARSIALDDEQGWAAVKQRRERRGDPGNVRVRVLFPRKLEPPRREMPKAVFVEVKAGVLAGNEQRRRDPAFGESAGDRSQLDRFRPGPDDQTDISEVQLSP
jgi:hypothetical protein